MMGESRRPSRGQKQYLSRAFSFGIKMLQGFSIQVGFGVGNFLELEYPLFTGRRYV
jgi:hypothetical protein